MRCTRDFSSHTFSLVLSGLLGLHHRINWKDTVLSQAEEKEDAVKFKKALQPFLPQ